VTQTTNTCRHPKCNMEKPVYLYACKTHWYQLPKQIRDKIWEGFRQGGFTSSLWERGDKEAMKYWEN